MKLIKNKKGVSQFFEMLLIMPFVIYIVSLMFFQMIGIIIQNRLSDFAVNITRTAITSESIDDAFNQIAGMTQYNKDFLISEITIIDEGNNEQKITFAVAVNSGSRFDSYVRLNREGEYEFDLVKYRDDAKDDYAKIAKAWKVGNLLKVTAYDDLSTNFYSSLTDVTFYTLDGQKQTLTMGLKTVVTATNIQTISNEE